MKQEPPEIDCKTVAEQLWHYMSDKKCEPTISQLHQWITHKLSDRTLEYDNIKKILEQNNNSFVLFSIDEENRVLLREAKRLECEKACGKLKNLFFFFTAHP